jgi:hypothetical protein
LGSVVNKIERILKSLICLALEGYEARRLGSDKAMRP